MKIGLLILLFAGCDASPRPPRFAAVETQDPCLPAAMACGRHCNWQIECMCEATHPDCFKFRRCTAGPFGSHKCGESSE